MNKNVWAKYESNDKTTPTQWFSSKMPPTKRRNSTASSASKRRKTTTPKKSRKIANKKRIASKRRKVIKGVVENVLHCKDNLGVYTKIVGGDFQPNCDQDEHRFCTWTSRDQVNIGDYSNYAMAFLPFTQKRVLDAASVLFNGKAATPLIDLATNNFDSRGLKVDLIYGSYELEFHNYTDIDYEVEIWEMTPKYSSNIPFHETLIELKNAMLWRGGVPYISPTVNVGALNNYQMHGALEFGMIKGLANKYKMKKYKSGVFKPGEKWTYFKTHKECYDFNQKMTVEGASNEADLASYPKGKPQVVFKWKPKFHLQYSETGFGFVGNVESSQSPSRGFLTLCKEVFKISQPPETEDQFEGDVRTVLSDMGRIADSAVPVFKSTGPSYVTRQGFLT